MRPCFHAPPPPPRPYPAFSFSFTSHALLSCCPVAGTIGLFTTLTGALAAATGVRSARPLSESWTDLAIDLGAIVVSGLLWSYDNRVKVRPAGLKSS